MSARMPDSRDRIVLWIFRVVFFATAVACVYFLGGREWFFGGLMLGWLWSVLEVAAMRQPVQPHPFAEDWDYPGMEAYDDVPREGRS